MNLKRLPTSTNQIEKNIFVKYDNTKAYFFLFGSFTYIVFYDSHLVITVLKRIYKNHITSCNYIIIKVNWSEIKYLQINWIYSIFLCIIHHYILFSIILIEFKNYLHLINTIHKIVSVYRLFKYVND